jgi:hypothetical protein
VVEVPTGEANKVDAFYCAVGSFGADGAVMIITQADEITNVFLMEHRWKSTHATALGTVNWPTANVRFLGLLVCS